MHLAVAKVPEEKTKEKRMRKPATLPEPVGEQSIYINTLKTDCPVEFLCLLGLNFDKTVLPPDASLTKNEGKPFQAGYIARWLAPNQVEALKNRAKEVYFLDKEGKELCAADWIVLVDAKNFSPLEIEIGWGEREREKQVTKSELSEELINQQNQQNKFRKK